MAIGMNKGRGVGRAKSGIGVPKGSNPLAAAKPGSVGKRPTPTPGMKPYAANGTGRGGQMKKMGGK